MEMIAFFAAIGAAIWGLFLMRKSSIVMQCFAVVVAGSVIGHTFYNLSMGPIPVTIDRVLFVLVCVQFGVFVAVHKPPIISRVTRIDLLVAVLCVVLTVGTFLYDFRYKENLPLGRLLFFNWMPMAIYFVIRFSKLKPLDLKLLFAGLTLFGAYLSITSICEVIGPQSLVFPSFITSPQFPEFFGRARGPFLNPVSLGVYQVVCLSGAMMFWPHIGKNGKALLLLIAPVFLLGIFLTLTRSIWLTAAWGAMLVCWIPADFKYKAVMASGAALLAMVAVVAFGDQFNGFKRDKNVSTYDMSQSAKLRPMLAEVAFQMFQDRPVFGCGFGQYSRVKKPYHYNSESELPLRTVLPYMQHNVFLSYLTESGLVGLTLLVSILSGFAFRSWLLWRDRSRSLWARQTGLVTLVMLSGYIINGMFHDVSIIPMMGTLLYFLGAVSVNAHQNLLTDDRTDTAEIANNEIDESPETHEFQLVA